MLDKLIPYISQLRLKRDKHYMEIDTLIFYMVYLIYSSLQCLSYL